MSPAARCAATVVGVLPAEVALLVRAAAAALVFSFCCCGVQALHGRSIKATGKWLLLLLSALFFVVLGVVVTRGFSTVHKSQSDFFC